MHCAHATNVNIILLVEILYNLCDILQGEIQLNLYKNNYCAFATLHVS